MTIQKSLRSLFQYDRDEPVVDKNGTIVGFNTTTDSIKFKEKIIGQTGNKCTQNLEIMVPLKYSSNSWRTLEMLLINCKTSLLLNSSVRCVVYSNIKANQATIFLITVTKFCSTCNSINSR